MIMMTIMMLQCCFTRCSWGYHRFYTIAALLGFVFDFQNVLFLLECDLNCLFVCVCGDFFLHVMSLPCITCSPSHPQKKIYHCQHLQYHRLMVFSPNDVTSWRRSIMKTFLKLKTTTRDGTDRPPYSTRTHRTTRTNCNSWRTLS